MKKLLLVLLGFALTAGSARAQSETGNNTAGTPEQPAKPPAEKKIAGPKTQDEYAAFEAANHVKDLHAAEVAASDFARKFPQSGVTFILYQSLMQRYQAANDSQKSLEMARTTLQYDPDNPLALTEGSSILAESIQDNDTDRDAKVAEVRANAKHALEVIGTLGAYMPANTPPDRVAKYKSALTFSAYDAMGTADLFAQDWISAEANFRKALEIMPDAFAYFRLALALDHQGKYADALAAINQATPLSKDAALTTNIEAEKTRLEAQVGTSAPAASTPK